MRQPNGGTAGIFGHAEVSYSGYNDGLSIGLVDAIWANPGLIPNFTGNGDNPQGNPVSHIPIYTLGDVCNQGLIRMVQTWGNNQYTFELLHYFGDPSMKIWTNNPVNIIANHPNVINCINDTTFSINNSNCLDATATLMVGNNLIGSANLVNGNGIIHFSQIYGLQATLTITGTNFRPYIVQIPINGNCSHAEFTLQTGKNCVMDSVKIFNLSSGNISTYNWNFGSDAIPSISNLQNPLPVVYSSSGNKTVTLSLTDINNNSYSYSQSFFIDSYCKNYMPINSVDSSNNCTGILYDNGGVSNDYSNNTNGTFIIHIPGANNITLNFSYFDFDISDNLFIFDGTSTSASLIGTYSGSNLPGGGVITSNSDAITIKQVTSNTTTKSGFEMYWFCNMLASPIADFKYSDSVSCKGIIQFQDLSVNTPDNWLWDFGDGTNSNIKNPIHEYISNGIFTVKLKTSNTYGNDSVIKSNIISINRPNSPIVTGNSSSCGSASFNLSVQGQGNINWYTTPDSQIPFDTGYNISTPILNSTTSYFIEAQTFGMSKYGGKVDSAGGGGYFNNTNIHYLVFDCIMPTLLKSVKIYSGSSGNRTINLRNSAGTIIATKTIFSPVGESRAELNFNIPVGSNYQLEGTANPNLFRNNGGCSYPYQIGNALTITKSSATQSPTAYYYFFYDWEIQNELCISPRKEVKLFVNNGKPIPGFSHNMNNLVVNFTNNTSDGNSYSWDFGDGAYSVNENPVHVYNSYGVYNAKLISYNACGTDSVSKMITIALNTDNIINENIVIYPNPITDILNINYKDSDYSNFIKIYNLSGQLIYKKLNFKNENISINFGQIAKGVYYLHIGNSEKSYFKKIVKI